MSDRLIIAFGHEQGVGKDTAVKLLYPEFRFRYPHARIKRVGFADPVKRITHEIYKWAGLQDKEYYDDHREEREIILPLLGKTPRQIWIDFGNAVRDHVYEPTWAEYQLRADDFDILFISDLRFPTEADLIQNASGFVYKITRPGYGGKKDGADDRLSGYTRWSGTIQNEEGLAEFRRKLIHLDFGGFSLKAD